MPCIKTTAIIKNGLSATATVKGAISSFAAIQSGKINARVNILSVAILTSATLVSIISTSASIISSGINADPCPLILCVDGGSASTVSYPSINGLLNGGSS